MQTACQQTNKEIRRFKVAINSACPLRCQYCFINKDSGENVSWQSIESLVPFMLHNPGDIKKLLIYGGEPFLNLPMVERIADYARDQAQAIGKSLDLSLCTSGVVAKTEEQLNFLARHQFFSLG